VEATAGIVEAADQSTLLVEEVGDLPLELQSNLLDVLESGVVRRIGEVGERQVDVRYLFTTNADLPTMVSRDQFRRDLYDRIMWLLIEVPPLSAHPEDILQLTEYFLRKHGERVGSEVLLAPGASAPLVNYSWPGNVRELELVVARAAMLSANGSVGEKHLVEALEPQRRVQLPGSPSAVPKSRYSSPSSENEERSDMVMALVRTRGNVTRAARQLGMGASTFWSKMKVHRLARTAEKLRAGERVEDIEQP
jgi:transcriptional regulator with GAF, ATPase, and Fis domain